MPSIIPVKDLKNATSVSSLCHQSNEPIFITKNGYGDMVIMSMEVYEQLIFKKTLYEKIEDGEKQFKTGKYKPASQAVAEIQVKYGL